VSRSLSVAVAQLVLVRPQVTIRATISRRMCKAAILMYCAMALFLITALWAIAKDEKLVTFSLIPFVVAMAATAYLVHGMRCPHCRVRLGSIVCYGGNPFRISPRVHFCPFCGVDLDSELDESAQA
jgi:hypothetical protein